MRKNKSLSRKKFIGNGLKTATALSLPSFLPLLQGCAGGMGETQIKIIEGRFANALPIPAVVNAAQASGVALTAHENISRVIANKKTKTFGYAGSILGPTLTANKGDTVTMHFKNQIFEESNIHWHGLKIPQIMDGLPFQVHPPQASYTYSYTINQRAGTYWYHPHPHGKTAAQVYMGLAGLFLVRDAEENALSLPSGANEIPLVIQDKRFSPHYSLTYGPSNMETMHAGYFGDHILTNGRFSNYLSAANRWYRFRILNGSTARIYNLKFSNNMSFSIIGTDGGLLKNPVTASSAIIATGERLDILVDLSSLALGSSVYLMSDGFSYGGNWQGNDVFKILKINIDRNEADTFTLPATLSATLPTIDTTNVVARRNFRLGRSRSGHTINGKGYELSRIDASPKANTKEIWTFDNSGNDMMHPMHMHAVQFRILSRKGGRASVLPFEGGFKDTVLVGIDETVEVLVEFPAHKGKFVYHCHNLEHEDHGMMANFEIV